VEYQERKIGEGKQQLKLTRKSRARRKRNQVQCTRDINLIGSVEEGRRLHMVA